MNGRKLHDASGSAPDLDQEAMRTPAQRPELLQVLEQRASDRLLARYAPLEPDDLSVERVWNRLLKTVSSESAPRQWIPVWAVASVAISAVFFAGFLFARRMAERERPRVGAVLTTATSPSAELDAAIGGVFFSRPAEGWQTGRSAQHLAEGERLRSDSSGRAVLEVSGVASVLLAPGTDVAIERLGSGTFLRLSRGSVVARVSKRPPGQPFVILTDGFSVKVVGTLFEVDLDSGRTTVSVREGTVEVAAADGATNRVEAGQKWSSLEPGKRGEAAIGDPVSSLLEAGLRGASASDLERGLEALAKTPAKVTAAVSPELPIPTAPPPAMRTAREWRPAGHLPSASPVSGAPPPLVLAEREPLPRESQTLEAAPAAAPLTGAYAEGLALERKGDFGGAAAMLSKAASESPSHADLALYALGRLFQHRLNDPQHALEAFEGYRKRYPHGTLAQEVDLAVLEIDVQTGARKEALGESARFLSTHPASERTAEVHVLRGNLMREAGDCRAALGEFGAASASAFAEGALLGTARCQRDLGNLAAARTALRACQTRFPAGSHRDDVARELDSIGKDF